MVMLEVYLCEIAEELDEEMLLVKLVELFHVVPPFEKGLPHPKLLVIEPCLVEVRENVIDFEECHVVN